MSKIYGNKGAKSCTTWSFPSYREDEIHLETCWHVWFRSSQFLIYPLVWMIPFLKENQQVPDADARCIGSQTTEQTLENTLHHP